MSNQPYEESGNRENRVNLTDLALYQYSYHPSLLSTVGDSFQSLLCGKYLRGERVWDQPITLGNTLRIGGLLGKGGYGEVYEIWKVTEPQRRFALKIPGPPLHITKSYILNEIQKLKTMSKPGNPHVPKIRDGFFYIRNERIPYYITHILTPIEREYSAFAQGEPIDPIATLSLFYMLACGLKYITSYHIIHNDIKPENIMFYGSGTPVITDYGTARSYSEINEVETERLQGRLHGTPTWLPPELISIIPSTDTPGAYYIYYNLGKVSQKTDIWGMALVLMRYLVGEGLFHDVPIKNYQVPDIFFTTFQQFSEAKIISRYRQYAYRRLTRFYMNPNSDIQQTKISDIGEHKAKLDLNLEMLTFLLLNNQINTAQKLQEQNEARPTPETEKRSMNSGRVLTAKLYLKKLQFLNRTRHFPYETVEFFISCLLDIFDLCTAPIENRIKVYQLVDVLENIFPGLISIYQRQLAMTNFPELISPEI